MTVSWNDLSLSAIQSQTISRLPLLKALQKLGAKGNTVKISITRTTLNNSVIHPRSIPGERMAKYEQGTAPSVMFENGEVVFAFREGKLEIRDEMVSENGCELHKKLIKYGAVCIEGNPINEGPNP